MVSIVTSKIKNDKKYKILHQTIDKCKYLYYTITMLTRKGKSLAKSCCFKKRFRTERPYVMRPNAKTKGHFPLTALDNMITESTRNA